MKRTPLKRKTSLRDSFKKKLKKEGTFYTFGRNGTIKRNKPLKKIARAQRTRQALYFTIHAPFLAIPGNEECQVCIRRREAGENIAVNPATIIHHRHGRIKKLLCYIPWFLASCKSCERWPHVNLAKARDLGIICPRTAYDVSPPQRELERNECELIPLLMAGKLTQEAQMVLPSICHRAE